MKIKEFRLMIDHKLRLTLTRGNYSVILQMEQDLIFAIDDALAEMEKQNYQSMAMEKGKYFLQFDKLA